MGGILRTTGELLVQSFWGIVVPTVVWIWNWIIVGLLWLVVGGFASFPLVIWGGLYLHSQLGGVLLGVVIWIVAALVLWIYIHLWIASAMWFDEHVFKSPYLVVQVWALILVVFWVLGSLLWLTYLLPTG